MERTIKMQVDIPERLSFKIKRYLLDLQESGVKKTKSQLLIELAEEALLKRITKRAEK